MILLLTAEPAFGMQVTLTCILITAAVLEIIKIKSTKLYGETSLLIASVAASFAAMANQLERSYYIQAGKSTQFIVGCVTAMRVLIAVATVCFIIGLAKAKFTKIYNSIKAKYDGIRNFATRHFGQSNNGEDSTSSPQPESESEPEQEQEPEPEPEQESAPQATPAPAPTPAPQQQSEPNRRALARTAAVRAYGEAFASNANTMLALAVAMEAFVETFPETTDEQYDGMMVQLEKLSQKLPNPQQPPQRPQGNSGGSRQQRSNNQQNRQNPQGNGGSRGSQQSN